MECSDDGFEVTGKVCPPKMPMDNLKLDNWQSLPSDCLDSLFAEAAIEGSKIIQSASLCALLSQASVVLSSDGLSHSLVNLPFYFCNFCDYNTASKLNLLKHIGGKHVFRCQLCDDFVSFTRCSLLQHQLQKHVDSEEMQPVLSAKTIQLSTSELQRHLKSSAQLSGSQRSPNREPVNSSLSCFSNKRTKSVKTGINFLSPVVSSNDLNSLDNKDPDTSSLAQDKNTDKLPAKVGLANCLKEHVEDSRSNLKFSDSNCLDVEEGLSSRCCMSGGDRKMSDQRHSQLFPHFLNESDSSDVTSSSNHQCNLSPSSGHRLPHNLYWPNVAHCHNPNYFTEASFLKKTDQKNFISEPSKTSNLMSSNNEMLNLQPTNTSPNEDISTPTVSSVSPFCVKNNSSLIKDTNGKEKSLSPTLLSVEKFSKQSEDGFPISSGLGFMKNTESDTRFRMVNFLMDSKPANDSHCVIEPEEKNQQVSLVKSKSKENFDLLRNLLVQKPTETMTNFSNKNVTHLKLKNPRSLPEDKMSSFVDSESNGSSNCWARASDMTLKELLTVSTPHTANMISGKDNAKPALPIFLVCGFCNFEANSKTTFDSHVEICKRNYSKQMENPIVKQASHCHPHPIAISEKFIKQENGESEENVSLARAGTIPTSEFTASGLLRSLTDQCLDNNVKNHRLETDPHNKDGDKNCASPNSNLVHKQSAVAETDKHKEKTERVHKKNTIIDISKMSPNFIFTDKKVSYTRIIDMPAVASRKRKHNYSEKEDVNEHNSTIESESSSDSDYRYNSLKNLAVKNRIAKNDMDMNQPAPRRSLQSSRVKQPHFYLNCLHCLFSTGNRNEMRQHLISKHPNNVPFSKATFELQKESLLYLCCGVNSSCTFCSTEGAEIFEHIKLCYSGHLDQFVEDKKDEVINFAPVLCSLGLAAKKLDSSPSAFYCLRCNFSNSNFQCMSHHISVSHHNRVAGIMFICRVPPETRVMMACLACHSHISIKQWCSHPCRKISSAHSKCSTTSVSVKNGNTTAASNGSASLHRSVESGKPSLLCELMAAEKGKIVETCNERTVQLQSDSKKEKDRFTSQANVTPHNHCHEDILIKQEILDVDDSNDAPAQLSSDAHAENESRCNGSRPTNTDSHSQDLHNLLSTSKETDLSLKNNSLLENLLRFPELGKEPKLPPLQITKTSHLPFVSQSKFSSMLETLSRQVSHTEQIASKTSDNTNGRMKNTLPLINAHVRNLDGAQKLRLKDPTKQDSASQLNLKGFVMRPAAKNCTPPPSLPLMSDLCNDVVQVSPPVIPRPPLLPLVPPASLTQSEENLSSHVPFSNLLRGLLCQVNTMQNKMME